MEQIIRPDKNRFLKALQCETYDRVPNWEFVLMQKNTESILGKEKIEAVKKRYSNLNTVWPARSESEINDRSALASYSCYLPAPEYKEVLEKTGQDTAVCTLS